jgi:hypothetical protein
VRWPPFLDRPDKPGGSAQAGKLEGLGRGGGDVGGTEQMRDEKVSVKEPRA